MASEIKLETKLVGSIEGLFRVPSYQRGYRWGSEEVTRLLEDVYTNGTKNYCLQPVVVRKAGDYYDLIDGQQRLTTIFLIYQYMHKTSGGFMDAPKFSLVYQTREKTEEFLTTIDFSMREDNIDFWFICNAYETIQQWFEAKEKKSVLTNINKYFDENVKIIWYEVGEDEDAIALFTRLNIGKIPLTSAELVKAMFLCRDQENGIYRKKQEEISLQWDNIERELQNDSLWYFLSNTSKAKFQTRIDLILNLISGKMDDNKELYYTYFYFDELKKARSLDSIWRDIQHTFLILKDWFENHELYHKIGYLIASESVSLQKLFDLSKGKTKDLFMIELNGLIRKSIAINGNYADLSYEKTTDYKRISKLLLLFNVESVRKNGARTQWFPFDKFKYQAGNKVLWSLEHIHAQQSEGLRTEESWREWLQLHLKSVKSVGNEELFAEMQTFLQRPKIEGQDFEDLQARVIACLSVQGNTEYLHSIANLALLNTSDNAALNNSTFDVKRNEIIEMDKAGEFIPFCTKMVFLKYYTPSGENQLHFWGQADRVAYVRAINSVLDDYLDEAIQVEMEAE
jgi:hypothetical protein